MITSPGRKIGLPGSTCLRHLELPTGLLAWGSGSGSPADLEWFRNLRAAAECDIQVGPERCKVRAVELTGSERDRVWDEVILRRAPAVARSARKAGRTIPVAVLHAR